MSTITTPQGIDYADVDSWLASRVSFIGASESPAIIGAGYANESAWTVYARKIGIETPAIDGEAIDWGHAMQPVILQMFTKRTGIKVEDLGQFTVLRNELRPFIGATLDGLAMIDGERAVVEAKNVGQYNARDWADDEPPLRVMVQMSHQMLAADANVAFATACVGGNKLEWRRIDRNYRFERALIKSLEEFWECVQTRTPPPVDGANATREIISRLWPEDNGLSILLPPESVEWDREFEKAKADKKDAESRETKYGNLIRAAMGEAAYGDVPGGGSYSWKTQTAEYAAKEAHTRVTRVLRRKK